ncbi:MAG: YggS family pyridoxal phosphate-dependent enzyme [Deinococcota bacterium]
MGILNIQARMEAACARAGRDPSEVTLVAVTKSHSPTEIDAAVLQHGQRILAENRIQEWRSKTEVIAAQYSNVEWHFIGNLQTNKVKYCRPFALIHSLNSQKLADKLEQQGTTHTHTFRVLVEVNVAGETSKQGADLDNARELVDYARNLPHVDVLGLMTLAPYSDDPENARPYFQKLRALRDELGLAKLSMGMSGDFEVAIEEGANYIRVGSALFK